MFYKNDNGTLLKGSVIENLDYILTEEINKLTLPIDGWHWFDSEEEAIDSLEIVIKDDSKDVVAEVVL